MSSITEVLGDNTSFSLFLNLELVKLDMLFSLLDFFPVARLLLRLLMVVMPASASTLIST